ncbi:MAG: hypothetical protein KAQ98_00720 [Bacteriovoracaceae bacterium]|nr:hypothetical protein [Bacteriovoracaceae bacterium]
MRKRPIRNLFLALFMVFVGSVAFGGFDAGGNGGGTVAMFVDGNVITVPDGGGDWSIDYSSMKFTVNLTRTSVKNVSLGESGDINWRKVVGSMHSRLIGIVENCGGDKKQFSIVILKYEKYVVDGDQLIIDLDNINFELYDINTGDIFVEEIGRFVEMVQDSKNLLTLFVEFLK